MWLFQNIPHSPQATNLISFQITFILLSLLFPTLNSILFQFLIYSFHISRFFLKFSVLFFPLLEISDPSLPYIHLINSFSHYFLLFFWWCWGLNSVLHIKNHLNVHPSLWPFLTPFQAVRASWSLLHYNMYHMFNCLPTELNLYPVAISNLFIQEV
jgi:hypothetical protein